MVAFLCRGAAIIRPSASMHPIRRATSTASGPRNSRSFNATPGTERAVFSALSGTRPKWSAAGSSHLFGTLSAVMLHTSKFDNLLADAPVTRLDVALDVYGIRPDDYVWELSKGIYRNPIMKEGKLQTLYLGNRNAAKGRALVRIYDKGAELGVPNLELTRIERVFKNNKLRVRDLPALSNVFQHTQMPRRPCRAGWPRSGWGPADASPLLPRLLRLPGITLRSRPHRKSHAEESAEASHQLGHPAVLDRQCHLD